MSRSHIHGKRNNPVIYVLHANIQYSIIEDNAFFSLQKECNRPKTNPVFWTSENKIKELPRGFWLELGGALIGARRLEFRSKTPPPLC